jgi:hypothetical protein
MNRGIRWPSVHGLAMVRRESVSRHECGPWDYNIGTPRQRHDYALHYLHSINASTYRRARLVVSHSDVAPPTVSKALTFATRSFSKNLPQDLRQVP